MSSHSKNGDERGRERAKKKRKNARQIEYYRYRTVHGRVDEWATGWLAGWQPASLSHPFIDSRILIQPRYISCMHVSKEPQVVSSLSSTFFSLFLFTSLVSHRHSVVWVYIRIKCLIFRFIRVIIFTLASHSLFFSSRSSWCSKWHCNEITTHATLQEPIFQFTLSST